MAVQGFITEARWLNENYIPTIEEYMHKSTKSCAYTLLILTSYIGMRENTTENIFNWVTNAPKIVSAAANLCRLMDEIVSSEVFKICTMLTRAIKTFLRKLKVICLYYI